MSPFLPAIKPNKIIRLLQKAGFTIDRITGGHYILIKDSNVVTVPFHNKDIRRGTLQSIIKQAGMTVKEFKELL